ncbi:uncharacterized protein LOC128957561 [Oppia nitens]|uniref:uncharacterized protein LOC128957561 n=1 Tax=Oppia nitens TaxID=1686743 RepID=UPI0023DC584F|nr:uncharacterized protein LOC128957561 [Oppia nitens]
MDSHKVIDLRSDTVTKPSADMRKAIYESVVGDNCYNEDPSVTELEKLAAKLVGKERALFVSSGTMSNLVAVMTHCWERGSEILLGDQAHIHINELGGIATVASVHHRTLTNNSDGTFSIDELVAKIRNKGVYPNPTLICLENTHNICNGSPLPLEFIDEVCRIAKQHNLSVHMDGARIFNASLKTGVPVPRILRDCDSVSFCLSKGLGCPVGSLLCGSNEFIERAWICRYMLGGAMRQSGILASAGLYALNNNIDRLAIDHKHALMISSAIAKHDKSYIRVTVKNIHTNIVYITTDPNWMTGPQFVNRLNTITEEERTVLGDRCVVVKMGSRSATKIRFVTHLDITADDIELVIEKLNFIINNNNQ